MTRTRREGDIIDIDDDRGRIDWSRVHGWLTTSYWCPGISLARVRRAADHSPLVVGAYADGEQVAFLRVMSDCTRFAYLCDVWVDAAVRGRGIGRALVGHALNREDFATCRWLLGTKDAHGVYAALGFVALAEPERFMIRQPVRDIIE